ncbi:MAG: SOS response-associated peptidase [Rhodobacteraceae bacterium]|nr:MAG: SOS response-associated peptidase [Paracoccaceae bacterium]
MCGRFALTLPHEAVAGRFAARPDGPMPPSPRYNICPTQPILTVRATPEGRVLAPMRWGFIPPWAKRVGDGPLLINARAETIAEKPAFREACRARRCLIPASGFYEWQAAPDGGKDPWWAEADGVVAFAGVWSLWSGPEGPVASAAIVTCAANAPLSAVHHRMPVAIAPEDYALWLGEAGKGAAALMRPAPDALFGLRRVSRAVNAARHDSPDLLSAAP